MVFHGYPFNAMHSKEDKHSLFILLCQDIIKLKLLAAKLAGNALTGIQQ
jgi:hypothetical protein